MINPSDEASAEYALGRDFAGKGDLEKARSAFERALMLQPDHFDARYDLARLLAQSGEWEKAAAAFRRLLELAPNFGQGYVELGIALDALGRSRDAIRAFETALEWDPSDAFAIMNLTHSLRKSGEVSELRDLFERAIRVAPWFEEAYQGLAGVLVEVGDFAGAEAALIAGEKAVANPEQRGRLQFSMGVLKAEQGEFEDAIRWLRTSLQTDPASCEAKVALAYALVETNRLREAADLIEAALEQTPRSADVHARLGSVLEKLGRYGEALSVFQQAMSMDAHCLETGDPDLSVSYRRAVEACEKNQ
jgi:tetratricopeptide (TPR) repeat protein